jgi:hypothetical protein
LRPAEHNLAPAPTTIPSGLPAWITADAIAKTLRTFQPLYAQKGKDFTQDDAVEVLLNIGNLFSFLKGGKREKVETQSGSETRKAG